MWLASFAGPVAADDLVRFSEEAGQRGLVYSYSFSGGSAGYGLAFGDLDLDGDPDLVAIGRVGGVVAFFENDGTGHFTAHEMGTGVPPLSGTSSLLLLDLDADGDLDVFFGRYAAPSRLYRNDGAFHFTDISVPSGLGVGTTAVTGCCAADVDLDGDIDLFLPRYGQTSRYFRNNGDGVFTEVGAFAGVTNGDWNAWQGVFLDYDQDGDPDLYVSNDKKVPTELTMHNRLYRNDGGGRFTEVSGPSGSDVHAYSMGVGVGDVDANGFDDLYCANLVLEPCPLLLNQGDATFAESTAAWGTEDLRTAWGTVFFDFDNDSLLDLYVCNFDAPNRLYRNVGQPPMVDVAPEVVADIPSFSHCIAVADIDGDGDIDLAVQCDGQPLKLLVNHEGEKRPSLRLDIEGYAKNTHAIGARVAVRTGTLWQSRTVLAGGNGFKGMHETRQTIGLGAAGVADELSLRWPDGAERSFTGVPAGTAWRLLRPESLGDGDLDGDCDPLDFVACEACLGGLVPGCEMFDLDGDFTVDAADVELLLARWTWPIPDCDADGVPDPIEIADDPALDADHDGALDACRASPADLDLDGSVGTTDLGLLLEEWGRPHSPADLDGDGTVGEHDLALLLGAWSA